MAQTSSHRFVGRRAESAALERLLETLDTGVGGFLAIGGEPGIGKTRLVQELCDRAEQRAFAVLRGRGLEFEGEVPYWILADALDAHFGALGEHELKRLARDRLSGLRRVVPALAKFDGKDDALGTERCLLRHALEGVLEDLAASGPLVLALDDLHWADDTSIESIAHAMRRRPRGPILFVLAYRASCTAPPLEAAMLAAERDGHLDRIDLGPLSADQADELVGHDLHPSVRRSLYRESGGNPFYLLELDRAVRENGRRTLARVFEPQPGDGPVPRLVGLAIADEIGRLTPCAQRFLEAAALSWEPFDPGLAAAVAGFDEEDALAALDELLATDIVQPREDQPSLVGFQGPRQFRFRHPIIRRAVYEGVGEARRRVAHARAAELFDRRGVPAALRAHHVERSASPGDENAIALLEQAAHDAMPRAPFGAARWFAAALRLLPADVDGTRRLALLTPLATALAAGGRIAESRAVLDEALALALAPRSPVTQRVALLTTMARIEHAVGERNDAAPLLTAALEEISEEPYASALRLELVVSRGTQRETERLAEYAAAAAAAARAADDGPRVGLATSVAALADKERGMIPSAIARMTESGQILDALSDQQLSPRVEVFAYLGTVESDLGRHSAAVGHLRRGLAIVKATGQDLFFVPLAVALGVVQVRLGRLTEADENAQAADEASTLLGDARSRTTASSLRCLIATRRGDLTAAIRAGEGAVEAARGAGSALLESLANRRLGEALIEAGDPGAGMARILDSAGGPDLAELPVDLRPRVHALLASAELRLGRADSAEGFVLKAESGAHELGLPARQADAELARASLLLESGGDGEAAAALADRASQRYRTLKQTLDAASADVLAGRALATADRREAAVARLERAHEVLAIHRAKHRAALAARDLRSLGRRLPRPRSRFRGTGLGSLSEREREVARLVASGCTNRAIAEELIISRKTVESHIASIFGKLGAKSRAEVARAVERAEFDGESTSTATDT